MSEAVSCDDHEALDAPTDFPTHLKLPCVTCMVKTAFLLHNTDPDGSAVMYRCSSCGRRALLEL